VGWPRWSPDGRWVLYDGASPTTGKSALFVIGIDQNNGTVLDKGREVVLTGFDGDITHGEWLPDSATVVAIAKEGPGRHAIVVAPAAGGAARVVHRFASEHDFPGLAVAPDGTRVAFIAPAPDGFFQVFQLPMSGGQHLQLSVDPTHKTQPAWSPDGARIAFTIWSYDVQFWLLDRRN
jgi:Tol biopolymer transport system component